MTAPGSTVVCTAWAKPAPPCQLPPINTCPPPVGPVARMSAPATTRTVSAVSETEPPTPTCDEASSRPATSKFPPAASRRITPPTCLAPLTSITPVLLMAALAKLAAATALMKTVPSGALTKERLSTKASTAPLSTTIVMPLAALVSVMAEPEAKVMLPNLARITPSFLTCGANSAIIPPSCAVSAPWLMTAPPPPVNW